MHQLHLILAYFGPETVMPVTSVLATVAALILVYGKRPVPAHCILGPQGVVPRSSWSIANRASFWAWPAPPTQHE